MMARTLVAAAALWIVLFGTSSFAGCLFTSTEDAPDEDQDALWIGHQKSAEQGTVVLDAEHIEREVPVLAEGFRTAVEDGVTTLIAGDADVAWAFLMKEHGLERRQDHHVEYRGDHFWIGPPPIR